MELTNNIDLNAILIALLISMGLALFIALVLMVWIFTRVKRINLPADAGFREALLATPFTVVLILDLLDWSLDFLSAPIGWLLLTKLGLGPLRGATMAESLIPGTQMIPTMTLAWILVRFRR